MLPPFISDAKDKHPTFIFSVIRSRMLPPFISDAEDKNQTVIFSLIRSRMSCVCVLGGGGGGGLTVGNKKKTSAHKSFFNVFLYFFRTSRF